MARNKDLACPALYIWSKSVPIESPFRSIKEQKTLQREHADVSMAGGEQIPEPTANHSIAGQCPKFVYSDRVEHILAMFPEDLDGKTALIVCGGTGLYGVRDLLDRGALVTLTDISPIAIEAARKRKGWHSLGNLRIKVEDAENLSFPDNHFDFCYVHEGLHHLAQPMKAIYEMYRVSRQRIVLVEPHDSLISRLRCKLRITTIYEGSGNYVYRFSRREIIKLASSLGAKSVAFRTFWNQYFRWLDKNVYPYLNNSLGYSFFKFVYKFGNLILSPQGNVLIAAIDKNVN